MWPFCENPVCPDPVWKPVKGGDREAWGSHLDTLRDFQDQQIE